MARHQAQAATDFILPFPADTQPAGMQLFDFRRAGLVAVLRDPLTAEGFTHARNAGDA